VDFWKTQARCGRSGRWLRGLGLLAACGLLQCADAEPLTSAPGAPPSPWAPGPHPVGVLTLTTGGPRALPVEVWYPATATAGAPERYALQLGAIKLGEMASPLGATRGAAVDLGEGPRPVVVFSHGSGGVRVQSVYLCEYLASHGFVVAAPDHLGNTMLAQINEKYALPMLEMARLRPLDLGETLDELLARSGLPGDPLAGAIDGARVGVAGHSFGAFTALRIAGATLDAQAARAACLQASGLLCGDWDRFADFPPSARDPRFIAALAQAPGAADVVAPEGIPSGFGAVAIPTMIQAGTADRTTPFQTEARAPFDDIPRDASLIALEDAGHFTFSDICALNLGLPAFEDGCGPDNLPIPAAHALIDGFAAAFFLARVAKKTGYEAYLAPASLPPGVASFDRK